MDDNTTVEIYMKSGNVLRLPLADMWWETSSSGEVVKAKWSNGDEFPSLNYMHLAQIEAIVVVKEPPMAGKVYDGDGNILIDLDSKEKK